MIAIVGMAAVMPGAGSLEDYWRNLVAGTDAITEVPEHRWDSEFYDPEQAHRPDRMYCRRGGFVDEYATFEPLKYGIMPNSIGEIEPDQLIALDVAAAAVEDAGGMDRLPAGDRVGVIIGRGGILSPAQARYAQRVRMSSQVLQILRDLMPDLDAGRLALVRDKIDESLGPYQPEGTIGLVPNLAASRIANRLNLRGPAYTLDAACASSLLAVDQGITELNAGRLDAVLAGGVHHVHDISFWSVFSQLRALSRKGQIRPFDRDADGLLIGEGTGVVVLKRLADAQRDGDRIYAVIRGCGTSSDGRSASMFNPATSGQVLAIRRAWEMAGLDPTAPDALGLLEAHGTATPIGDTAELASVAEVFGPHRGGSRPVIGSVKSMIGHTMPAAGIAGLIKATLAVSRGVLLPTLHCDNPRPELERTRFRPLERAEQWNGGAVRRAGVNAFGFGGINAHIVIEQAPDSPSTVSGWTPVAAAPAVEVDEPDRVLWLTAPTPDALARLLDTDDVSLRAKGVERVPQGVADGCRLGVVDPTDRRLSTARQAVARGRPWRGGRDIWYSPQPLLSGGGRLAFMFPGLEAEFRPRVNDVEAHFGFPVRDWATQDLVKHGAGIIEVGKLLDTAMRRLGVVPDAIAGHSMGEWTAAAVTGLVSTSSVEEFLGLFDSDASAVEVSGYVFGAIGASIDQVVPMLPEYPGVVLTHDNAPSQCVVNGPEPEVDRLLDRLRRNGILCQTLPFRSAFHTPLFAGGLASIGAALRDWRVVPPSEPVWSATVAQPFPDDPEEVGMLFFRHMIEPVRFRTMISAMYDAGFRVFLQVGPGQLASVIDDNLRDHDHLAMPVNVTLRSGLNQLRRVATALWVEGAGPDLKALDPPASRSVSSPARKGPVVKLDLGGPLVRLGQSANGLLGPITGARAVTAATNGGRAASPTVGAGRDARRAPTPAAMPTAAPALAATSAPVAHTAPVPAAGQAPVPPASPAPAPGALAALDRLAGGSSAAAELAALLRDTAASAVSVLGAAVNQGPPGVLSKPPAGPPVAPSPPAGAVVYRERLRISLETMPYLRDHCFFVQPDDWPNPEDRWPVVPATTVVALMMAAAERAAPGLRAVAVREARFHRWVIAAPAQDVEVSLQAVGQDRFIVAFGGFARATVEMARAYPGDPPPPFEHDPATERPPTISAQEMYAERLMFHGPLFHGVTKVHALGQMHVRGVVTTPAPPGALLDNALQLIGNWLITTQPFRTVALPVELGHVRFFGPPPAPGKAFECVARVRSIDDAQLVADTQLIDGGRVFAIIEQAVDRRFDSHPTARPAERFPERNPMSMRQPEGWTMAFDCWTDLVTQGMAARGVLGGAAYVDYERQKGPARKLWLLGRIAAKDAVRFLLWEDGRTDVFPIELTITNEANGRPRVVPRPGRGFCESEVSIAHVGEIAVAIAKRRGPGDGPDTPSVGIDVAEITDRPESTVNYALSASEIALLDSLGGERARWFTCLWAAKEAAGKAEGTGLDGNPRRFTVTAVTPGGTDGMAELAVEVAGRIYRVRAREVTNPPELPPRRYMVAWVLGPETTGVKP